MDGCLFSSKCFFEIILINLDLPNLVLFHSASISLPIFFSLWDLSPPSSVSPTLRGPPGPQSHPWLVPSRLYPWSSSSLTGTAHPHQRPLGSISLYTNPSQILLKCNLQDSCHLWMMTYWMLFFKAASIWKHSIFRKGTSRSLSM